MLGGQVGLGTLFFDNGRVEYYQLTAGSYGLQAGIQQFGYALFLMDDEALRNVHRSGGWELGGSPGVVIVDKGISGTLSTTTIRSGTYAFTFNQKGLMAGLGLQGAKITRINPGR